MTSCSRVKTSQNLPHLWTTKSIAIRNTLKRLEPWNYPNLFWWIVNIFLKRAYMQKFIASKTIFWRVARFWNFLSIIFEHCKNNLEEYQNYFCRFSGIIWRTSRITLHIFKHKFLNYRRRTPPNFNKKAAKTNKSVNLEEQNRITIWDTIWLHSITITLGSSPIWITEAMKLRIWRYI